MYLDRHDLPGVSPEDLAEAHRRDVDAQARYDVRYHTYWFDPESGAVFCLAEGPSREAIEAVHRDAHGITASTVIELDPRAPLNSLFGPLPQHPVGAAYAETALRAIVFTDICGSVEMTRRLGDDGHMHLLHEHNGIVRNELAGHQGREVKHTGDGVMASFTSVSSAVEFSAAVQRALHVRNSSESVPLHVSIGISAGEPVTDDNLDLFGAAVQLAARLCAAAEPGEVVVSVAVRELCVGKSFLFEKRGELSLKGISEPTPAFRLAWLD
jgi:class 3 adenylate cyclase